MVTTLFTLFITAVAFFLCSFFINGLWCFYLPAVYVLVSIWLYLIHLLNKQYVQRLLKQYKETFSEVEKHFLQSNSSLICVLAKTRTIFAIAEYRSAVVWINVIAIGGIVYCLFIKELLLASMLIVSILVFLLSDIKSAFPYAEENYNLLQVKKNYNKHCQKEGLSELDNFQAQGVFESIFKKLETLALEQKKQNIGAQ
ncbi:MAG: hypothetical protein HY609_03750 [Deltaproteobacteria bacterium]|nr:hypothetical protein [Deltaproteobacteria bacterium]